MISIHAFRREYGCLEMTEASAFSCNGFVAHAKVDRHILFDSQSLWEVELIYVVDLLIVGSDYMV